MKLNPVPTSPKSQKNEKVVKEIYAQNNLNSFEKPLKRSKNGLMIIIISLFSGFIAGFLAGVILQALLIIYPDLPVLNQLSFFTYPSSGGIIIQKNEKNLTAQEFQVQEMLDQLKQAVVIIFPKKTDLEETNPLTQTYLSSEAKGNGIILTNDGLLMTTREVISDDKGEYVALTSEKNLYPIKDIIIDPSTQAVFFRIKASNLSIVDFINPVELQIGQKLFSLQNKINGSFEAFFTELRSLRYYPANQPVDLIYSTESFSDRILLSSSLPAEYKGSPVFTLEGKVIGLIQNNQGGSVDINLVLPAQYFRPAVNKILKNGKIDRILFGIHYLDLSRLTNVSKELSGGLTKGVLIYGDNALNLPAILKQSPAQKANLKAGDIITKVEGQEIDRNHSLTEIIQEFEKGKKIEINILRNNQEQKLELELKVLETP